jgi:hypothetical protein
LSFSAARLADIVASIRAAPATVAFSIILTLYPPMVSAFSADSSNFARSGASVFNNDIRFTGIVNSGTLANFAAASHDTEYVYCGHAAPGGLAMAAPFEGARKWGRVGKKG